MLADLNNQLIALQLVQRGGPVLWGLFALLLVLSVLALERLLFLIFSFPKLQHQWLRRWQQRGEQHSWYAKAQRNAWLGEAENQLLPPLRLLKLLVSLCPMFGLLGTVTGMIRIFELMAQQSQLDPKLLAAGISMATLPTMAGLMAALVGMFAYARLLKLSQSKLRLLTRLLRSGE